MDTLIAFAKQKVNSVPNQRTKVDPRMISGPSRLAILELLNSYLPKVTCTPRFEPRNSSLKNRWYVRIMEQLAFESATSENEYLQCVTILCEYLFTCTSSSLQENPVDLFYRAHALPSDFQTATPVLKTAATDRTQTNEDVLFRCKKCGKPANWTQRQTRSADEAMTVFIHCPYCGFKERIG